MAHITNGRRDNSFVSKFRCVTVLAVVVEPASFSADVVGLLEDWYHVLIPGSIIISFHVYITGYQYQAVVVETASFSAHVVVVTES